jgi:hypothetical protein
MSTSLRVDDHATALQTIQREWSAANARWPESAMEPAARRHRAARRRLRILLTVGVPAMLFLALMLVALASTASRASPSLRPWSRSTFPIA